MGNLLKYSGIVTKIRNGGEAFDAGAVCGYSKFTKAPILVLYPEKYGVCVAA